MQLKSNISDIPKRFRDFRKLNHTLDTHHHHYLLNRHDKLNKNLQKKIICEIEKCGWKQKCQHSHYHQSAPICKFDF